MEVNFRPCGVCLQCAQQMKQMHLFTRHNKNAVAFKAILVCFLFTKNHNRVSVIGSRKIIAIIIIIGFYFGVSFFTCSVCSIDIGKKNRLFAQVRELRTQTRGYETIR